LSFRTQTEVSLRFVLFVYLVSQSVISLVI